MKRIVHVWLCVALAQCQPVPAYEFDTHEGKPIIRLTADEARACMADGKCRLLTQGQLEALLYRSIGKQCGRDA